MAIKIQEALRAQNRLYEKKKSTWYIIIKRLYIGNKESKLKAKRESKWVTDEGRTIKTITLNSVGFCFCVCFSRQSFSVQ